MARTYTNTPEPRYVEKAKTVEGGGGGGIVLLDIEYDPEADFFITKDKYSFEDLKAIFLSGKVPAIYIADENIQTTEEEKTEDDTYRLTIFSSIEYRAASDADSTVAIPYEVKCNSNYEDLVPDIADISAFDKSAQYFWATGTR